MPSRLQVSSTRAKYARSYAVLLLLMLVIPIVLDEASLSMSGRAGARDESHAHYLIPAIDIDDLSGNGCSPVAGEKNSRSA